MVSKWIFPILVGAVLGGLSGLGVGGGSLLLLWLTLVMGLPQEQARLMNLMFFLPCALTASLFRWRQGKLNLRLTAAAAVFGCVGAVLGNLLRRGLDLEALKKVFGVIFLLCGVRELLYRPKKEDSGA